MTCQKVISLQIQESGPKICKNDLIGEGSQCTRIKKKNNVISVGQTKPTQIQLGLYEHIKTNEVILCSFYLLHFLESLC